MQHASNIF